MNFLGHLIKDVQVIVSNKFLDNRGVFYESFRSSYFESIQMVQENHSISIKKGTFRGLHLQNADQAQSKYISCIKGSILDVILDLRPNSNTYLKWMLIYLDSETRDSIFVPRGCAHGYLTLEDMTEVVYKVDRYYSPESELVLSIHDDNVNIELPWIEELIMSDRDLNGLSISDLLTIYIPPKDL